MPSKLKGSILEYNIISCAFEDYGIIITIRIIIIIIIVVINPIYLYICYFPNNTVHFRGLYALKQCINFFSNNNK